MPTVTQSWNQCWQRSRKGNLWQRIRIDDDTELTVTLFLQDGTYRVCLAGAQGQMDFIELGHANEAKARKQALEVVEGMI